MIYRNLLILLAILFFNISCFSCKKEKIVTVSENCECTFSSHWTSSCDTQHKRDFMLSHPPDTHRVECRGVCFPDQFPEIKQILESETSE